MAGALADWQIREQGIVTPYSPCKKTAGVISWGVQPYGYDLRLARNFKHINPALYGRGLVIDPKKVEASLYEECSADWFDVPAHGFVLGHSVEWVRIPRDCTAIVADKSSYRRCGILMGATILEAAWEGRVVLEITNSAPVPVRVYAGEGICQMVVFAGSAPCGLDYVQKGGRYQCQEGITLPSVD